MNFLDPTNDLVFKKIFGNEKKPQVLISFLNSCLGFTGQKKIKSIEFTNPYQVPDIKELKETILDVRVKNEAGEEFIIEMQKQNQTFFDKRSLYYTSKAYVAQLPVNSKNKNSDENNYKTPNYSTLKKIYFIGILEFNLFNNPEDTSFISQHLIYNKQTGNNDLKDFEFCFIELPKFNKTIDELKDNLDKWIFFLKEAQNLDIVPKELANIEELNEAFFTANQTSWNSEELDIYQKINLDENQRISSENVKIEKEKKKSRKEGRKEGLEKGLENALAKMIHSGINKEKAKIILGL